MAYTHAVYASPHWVAPTPHKTRFRWVATLTGQDLDLPGPLRRVSGSATSFFLPSQAYLGARHLLAGIDISSCP